MEIFDSLPKTKIDYNINMKLPLVKKNFEKLF